MFIFNSTVWYVEKHDHGFIGNHGKNKKAVKQWYLYV
jgi:hypothetical protein